jgi:branched-chain amino acid transport system permease protein
MTLGRPWAGRLPALAIPWAARVPEAVWPWLVRVPVLALLALAPLVLGDFRLFLLTSVLIFGLFAASLDLLVGYAGLLSAGHAAYWGVGAYAAALVATRWTPNAFAQLGVAVAATALAAVATGWLAVRARGVYFLMLTLAFSQLLFTLALTWDSLTHGSNGLPTPAPRLLSSGGDPLDGTAFYYYALVSFAVGYLFLRVVVAYPFGRALVAIRENEARLSSVGYNVFAYKLAAFCLAGAVAGYAGALAVQHAKYVSPSDVSFEISALALVAVIVGGRATLYGAVLGAAFVYIVRDELSSAFSEHWRLVLGLVFIGVVYVLPRGLGGLVQQVGREFAQSSRQRP